MPKLHPDDRLGSRHLFTRIRNKVRFNFDGKPPKQARRLGKLARRGFSPAIRAELKQLKRPWVKWATNASTKSVAPEIRVEADTNLTSRAGATPSFVGVGLDESVPTRLLKIKSLLKGVSAPQARDLFGARSRNADLVWRNPPDGLSPADWEPIAGHAPSIKDKIATGNTGNITTGHGNGRRSSGRDGARQRAFETSLADTNSPNRFSDAAIIASLATIKLLSSPSTELSLVKQDVANLTTARYSALTGTADLRTPAVFDSLVEHVQEERERKKWEVGSVLHSSTRLSPLVPPVIRNYLQAHGNDPHAAREKFRYDLHKSWWPAPSVNQSVSSDTVDLEKHSLHVLATKTTTTGRRKRALSDARWLPPVAPPNSRGQ
jgi:hypothetical protein